MKFLIKVLKMMLHDNFIAQKDVANPFSLSP